MPAFYKHQLNKVL